MARTKFVADNINNTLDFVGALNISATGVFPNGINLRSRGGGCALRMYESMSGSGYTNPFGDTYNNQIYITNNGSAMHITNMTGGINIGGPAGNFVSNGNGILANVTGTTFGFETLLGVCAGFRVIDMGAAFGHGGFQVDFRYPSAQIRLVTDGGQIVITTQNSGATPTNGTINISNTCTGAGSLYIANSANGQVTFQNTAAVNGGMYINNYNSGAFQILQAAAQPFEIIMGGANDLRILHSAVSGNLIISQLNPGKMSIQNLAATAGAQSGIEILNTLYGKITMTNNAPTTGGIEIRNTAEGFVWLNNSAGSNGGITVQNANNGPILISNGATTVGGIDIEVTGNGGLLLTSTATTLGTIEIENDALAQNGSYAIWMHNENVGSILIENNASSGGGININNNYNGNIQIQNMVANSYIQMNVSGLTLELNSTSSVGSFILNCSKTSIFSRQYRNFHSHVAGDSPVTVNNYTVFIYLADTAAGDITYNLPAASGENQRMLKFKNIGTNTAHIVPNGSDNIDGSNTTIDLAQNEFMTLICDGTAWWII